MLTLIARLFCLVLPILLLLSGCNDNGGPISGTDLSTDDKLAGTWIQYRVINSGTETPIPSETVFELIINTDNTYEKFFNGSSTEKGSWRIRNGKLIFTYVGIDYEQAYQISGTTMIINTGTTQYHYYKKPGSGLIDPQDTLGFLQNTWNCYKQIIREAEAETLTVFTGLVPTSLTIDPLKSTWKKGKTTVSGTWSYESGKLILNTESVREEFKFRKFSEDTMTLELTIEGITITFYFTTKIVLTLPQILVGKWLAYQYVYIEGASRDTCKKSDCEDFTSPSVTFTETMYTWSNGGFDDSSLYMYADHKITLDKDLFNNIEVEFVDEKNIILTCPVTEDESIVYYFTRKVE
ncbi:MAG TPA: hypothetical protein VHO70_14140 [Chitinispirillaceae bacterium]|nr:hypothetical protein [Chitinispirillaceae bacterium]